jgi:Mrp family chromosome partitioning ATPase
MPTDGAFIDAYAAQPAVARPTERKLGDGSLPAAQDGANVADGESAQPIRPPKMVVGRKALQSLAANTAQTTTRAGLGQSATARPPESRRKVSGVLDEPVPSQSFDEQELVELSAVPRAPAVRSFRMDRQESRERGTDTSSYQATDAAIESIAAAGDDNRQCATQDRPATLRAELEVDRLCWPVMCERLISARRHDLRVVVDKIEECATSGPQVIAVASTQQGEGCTTVLLCLARLLAERNRSVCLVDANLARPSLAAQLGLCPETSWSEALAQNRSIGEALIESQTDRINVLPMLSSESEDRLEHLQTSGVLTVLRSTFDFVLIDAGALATASSTTAENASAVSLADACLLIKKEASGSRCVEHACRRLEDWQIPLVGLVENRCQA